MSEEELTTMVRLMVAATPADNENQVQALSEAVVYLVKNWTLANV